MKKYADKILVVVLTLGFAGVTTMGVVVLVILKDFLNDSMNQFGG